MTVEELTGCWRERAEQMRPYAPGSAAAFETAATELETALRARAIETLNLRDAARESGYSPDHLARLLKAGKIPNAGRKRAPKIRRGDLPQKPGRGPALSLSGARREAALSKDRRLE